MDILITTTIEKVTAQIVDAFARTSPRLPKHVRLYDAITGEIDYGRLVAGEKLTGERELGAAVGLSLGTVQKALGLLVTDGRIVREHGRGTFIREGRRPMTDLWHFRFRDPKTRGLLPVYAHVHSRTLVEGEPAWVDAVGQDPAGYVRLCRLISIGDQLRCWAEMYLPASRFGRLLTLPQSDVESVNLKQLLAVTFGAPTLATAQTVMVQPMPRHVREALGAGPRSIGLTLQIVATSRRSEPITFQRIYVPQSNLEMEIGAEIMTAAREHAA